MEATTTKKKGINGDVLKLIAMAIMLIDHIGAIILERMLVLRGLGSVTEETAAAFLEQNTALYWADFIMREIIGRVACPIFLFLLFEGFRHTSNRVRYLINLSVFALISEIPYNLSLTGHVFALSRQSIGLTLVLCLILLYLLDFIEQKDLHAMAILGIQIISVVMFAALAIFTGCEYSGSAILAITAIYFFRNSRMMSMLTGCLALSALDTSSIASFLCLIPIHFYNGERGTAPKYAFYAFYPLHLLILFGIAYFMGLGTVSLI